MPLLASIDRMGDARTRFVERGQERADRLGASRAVYRRVPRARCAFLRANARARIGASSQVRRCCEDLPPPRRAQHLHKAHEARSEPRHLKRRRREPGQAARTTNCGGFSRASSRRRTRDRASDAPFGATRPPQEAPRRAPVTPPRDACGRNIRSAWSLRRRQPPKRLAARGALRCFPRPSDGFRRPCSTGRCGGSPSGSSEGSL